MLGAAEDGAPQINPLSVLVIPGQAALVPQQAQTTQNNEREQQNEELGVKYWSYVVSFFGFWLFPNPGRMLLHKAVASFAQWFYDRTEFLDTQVSVT